MHKINTKYIARDSAHPQNILFPHQIDAFYFFFNETFPLDFEISIWSISDKHLFGFALSNIMNLLLIDKGVKEEQFGFIMLEWNLQGFGLVQGTIFHDLVIYFLYLKAIESLTIWLLPLFIRRESVLQIISHVYQYKSIW